MSEDQLQAECVKWFDEEYPEHRQMLFSVPNGGERKSEIIMTSSGPKRVSKEANKLMATGVRAGVSDLIFIVETAVYFIEAKIPGGIHSDHQINFCCRVEERGHSYQTFYTFEEFKTIINKIIVKHYGK